MGRRKTGRLVLKKRTKKNKRRTKRQRGGNEGGNADTNTGDENKDVPFAEWAFPEKGRWGYDRGHGEGLAALAGMGALAAGKKFSDWVNTPAAPPPGDMVARREAEQNRMYLNNIQIQVQQLGAAVAELAQKISYMEEQ